MVRQETGQKILSNIDFCHSDFSNVLQQLVIKYDFVVFGMVLMISHKGQAKKRCHVIQFILIMISKHIVDPEKWVERIAHLGPVWLQPITASLIQNPSQSSFLQTHIFSVLRRENVFQIVDTFVTICKTLNHGKLLLLETD